MKKFTLLISILLFLLGFDIYAGIIDFNRFKYDLLILRYNLSGSNNQEVFLNNFIEGNGDGQLGISSDFVLDNISDSLSTYSTGGLVLSFDLTNNYISLINSGFLILNDINSFMKPANCGGACTLSSNGGIGFLNQCVNNISLRFTSSGVYCSNVKFLEKYNETKFNLIKKLNKVIKLQKDIQFELSSKSVVMGNLNVSGNLVVDQDAIFNNLNIIDKKLYLDNGNSSPENGSEMGIQLGNSIGYSSFLYKYIGSVWKWNLGNSLKIIGDLFANNIFLSEIFVSNRTSISGNTSVEDMRVSNSTILNGDTEIHGDSFFVDTRIINIRGFPETNFLIGDPNSVLQIGNNVFITQSGEIFNSSGLLISNRVQVDTGNDIISRLVCNNGEIIVRDTSESLGWKCALPRENLLCTARNGGWSSTTYTNCSQSCGGGRRTWTRVCNNPVPRCGGQPCVGAESGTEVCNTESCARWCYIADGEGKQTQNNGVWGHCIPVSCNGPVGDSPGYHIEGNRCVKNASYLIYNESSIRTDLDKFCIMWHALGARYYSYHLARSKYYWQFNNNDYNDLSSEYKVSDIDVITYLTIGCECRYPNPNYGGGCCGIPGYPACVYN